MESRSRPSKAARRRTGPLAIALALLVVSGWLGARAAAEEPTVAAHSAPEETPAPQAAPPSVSLDRLLKLPSSIEVGSEDRRGGFTRSEWRARFAEVEAQRAQSQAALDEAHQELGELAAETSDWQMAAPGLGTSGGEKGPLSYRLRQEMNRYRSEIAAADRRLQELRVEAGLAGVPDEWLTE